MNSKAQTINELEAIFHRHGFSDFKWTTPDDIIVSNWVRMKCKFGCPDYGRIAACPPNTLSVSECREFFSEYTDIAIFHLGKKLDSIDERHDLVRDFDNKLLELEKEVFLAGNVKTFLLFAGSCSLCKECANLREECKQPYHARPTAEAMAVDVFSSVRNVGYPIEVLKEYTDTMNRYAFLLVR